MKLLLSKTIPSRKGKCLYKLYEFKLAPGLYQAQLVSPELKSSLSRIIFKKEHGRWKTSQRSREAQRLADIFGNAIEKRKIRH